MKEYSVIVSEHAKEMLTDHILFIADVNREAAIRIKNKLIQSIRELSAMPNKYPFFDADYIPANKYHKMCIEKRYLVLYQIADDIVYVDYIIDCRQDYQWLIK